MGASWSIDAYYHDLAGLDCYVQFASSTGVFNGISGMVADNTDDDWLAATWRGGKIKYSFPVPVNHLNYMVVIYVAEHEYNQLIFRQFHVVINGEVVDNVDVMQRSGLINRLYPLIYFVNTTRGYIQIELMSAVGSTREGKLNGILIKKADGSKVCSILLFCFVLLMMLF